MRRNILIVLGILVATGLVLATPWAQTYSMNGTTVAVTNQQANNVWMPAAVLWKFPTATNATLTVTRISQGNAYLLGNLTASNASTVIWVPEADYPFDYGEALQLTSTVTNGQVQIIRKGN